MIHPYHGELPTIPTPKSSLIYVTRDLTFTFYGISSIFSSKMWNFWDPFCLKCQKLIFSGPEPAMHPLKASALTAQPNAQFCALLDKMKPKTFPIFDENGDNFVEMKSHMKLCRLYFGVDIFGVFPWPGLTIFCPSRALHFWTKINPGNLQVFYHPLERIVEKRSTGRRLLWKIVESVLVCLEP